MDKIYFAHYINLKFLNACVHNKLEIVKGLVNSEYNIDYNFNYLQIVEIEPIQVEDKNIIGNKCIFKYSGFSGACYNGHVQIIKYLLDKNIDINFSIENLFEYKIPDPEIFKLLIKTNKNINLNYDRLKIYKLYDPEIIELMKSEKFLNQNNKYLILKILENINFIKNAEIKNIIDCKDSCSICFEPFQEPITRRQSLLQLSYKKKYGTNIVNLPCNHNFCIPCMEDLWKYSRRDYHNNFCPFSNIKSKILCCPLCRNKFISFSNFKDFEYIKSNFKLYELINNNNNEKELVSFKDIKIYGSNQFFVQHPPLFGQVQQPSLFGQVQQPSLFGQVQQPSLFGQVQHPLLFGQVQQPEIFSSTNNELFLNENIDYNSTDSDMPSLEDASSSEDEDE